MFFVACFNFKKRCNNISQDIKQRALVFKCQSQKKQFDHFIKKTQWQKDISQND